MFQKFVDEWSVVAEIRMLRQTHKGAFLIVEGSSDSEVISKCISVKKCVVVVAWTRENAIKSLRILEGDGFAGVVSLVDRDYDTSVAVHGCKNLIFTDYRDLEIVLFCSDVLDEVLKSLGRPSKIGKIGNLTDVRNRIFASVIPLGYLRQLSFQHGWALKFRGHTYSFIAPISLSCDEQKMIAVILGNSSPRSAQKAEPMLRSGFSVPPGTKAAFVCSGHDTMHALSVALTNLLGSKHWNDVKPSSLEAEFRRRAKDIHIHSLDMWAELKRWSARSSFAIL